jgi:hypothetical protein
MFHSVISITTELCWNKTEVIEPIVDKFKWSTCKDVFNWIILQKISIEEKYFKTSWDISISDEGCNIEVCRNWSHQFLFYNEKLFLNLKRINIMKNFFWNYLINDKSNEFRIQRNIWSLIILYRLYFHISHKTIIFLHGIIYCRYFIYENILIWSLYRH